MAFPALLSLPCLQADKDGMYATMIVIIITIIYEKRYFYGLSFLPSKESTRSNET